MESTIISSKFGQVVYPAFFEANDFMREGFMQLCAFPGRLRKDDMDFNCLIDAFEDVSEYDSEDVDSEIADLPQEMDVHLTDSNDEDDGGDQLFDMQANQEAEDIDGDEAARREDSAIRAEQANEQEREDTSDSQPEKTCSDRILRSRKARRLL
jgi:hypothetical protein